MFDRYPRAFLELKYDLMVSSSYDLNLGLKAELVARLQSYFESVSLNMQLAIHNSLLIHVLNVCN